MTLLLLIVLVISSFLGRSQAPDAPPVAATPNNPLPNSSAPINSGSVPPPSTAQAVVVEPRTPAELERHYAIPSGEKDASQVWLQALRTIPLGSIRNAPITTREYPPPGQSWPQLAAASQFVAENQVIANTLHQAAQQPGRGRFPTNFAQGFMMPLPEADLVRDGFELLEIEAYVHGHQGNHDGMIRSLNSMYSSPERWNAIPYSLPFSCELVALRQPIRP